MLVLADSEVEVGAIASVLGYAVCTVRRWIRRGRTTGAARDRPRSGRPPIYTQESRLRLLAFYCQTRPLPGCGRWTLEWATRRLKADPEQDGPVPSTSTLSRILRTHQLRPHQSRYFLHITDPDFFPKMEHLLALYRNPPRNLIFFDESPGIQVLKRLVPDLQTDGMRIRLEEFEYIRNGTMDVLAFLNHADGQVHLECQADHTTDTLVGVVRRHVDRFPSTEPLHYVMDNLSTHRCYPFCQIVAELSGVDCPPERELKTAVERAHWLAREDKRIVVHFTPYHGSWLNLVEIWFGIMGSKVLGESFGSAHELKAALEAFVVEWNTLLAHPFRWSYDGKGLHDKAVQRFTKMLTTSAAHLDVRMLTKLMGLMTNLLRDYFQKVHQGTWAQLVAVLRSQSATIADLIEREDGPRRKRMAQQAATNLAAALQAHSFRFEGIAP